MSDTPDARRARKQAYYFRAYYRKHREANSTYQRDRCFSTARG